MSDKAKPKWPIHCPECGCDIGVAMKESLEPYSMTMTITPDHGRTVAAHTVGGIITELTGLLTAIAAIGKEMGQKTHCVVLGVDVDDDMVTTIRISAVPESNK
jgi:hypothetical protein